MADNRIIYEDEIEWLYGALLEREKVRAQNGKRPIIPTSFIHNEEFLYDYMMWLKYGIKPE